MKRALDRIHRVLHTPLFGTVPITKETRVDPAEFPEDAFPLNCGTCRYSLRANTAGRCPECGTPIDRGRRLVEQYVIESWQLPDDDSNASRFAQLVRKGSRLLSAVCMCLTTGLVLLVALAPATFKSVMNAQFSQPFWRGLVMTPFGVFLMLLALMYLLLIIKAIMHLTVGWEQRKRRIRVKAAIDRDYRAGKNRRLR